MYIIATGKVTINGNVNEEGDNGLSMNRSFIYAEQGVEFSDSNSSIDFRGFIMSPEGDVVIGNPDEDQLEDPIHRIRRGSREDFNFDLPIFRDLRLFATRRGSVLSYEVEYRRKE